MKPPEALDEERTGLLLLDECNDVDFGKGIANLMKAGGKDVVAAGRASDGRLEFLCGGGCVWSQRILG